MAQEPEVIRQNIEETRSELSRKIECLENEVVGTVKGTTATVAETVENVRGTVQDTVASMKDSIESTLGSVKDTFDLPLQTRRHPWAVMSGSVFAGFMLGSLLPPRRSSWAPAKPSYTPATPAPVPPNLLADRSPPVAAKERKPSFLAGIMEHFDAEIQQLKGVAIGAAAAMVRDLLKDKIPPALEPHMQDMIHNVTHKLGGEDVKGRVLPEPEDEPRPSFARQAGLASRH